MGTGDSARWPSPVRGVARTMVLIAVLLGEGPPGAGPLPTSRTRSVRRSERGRPRARPSPSSQPAHAASCSIVWRTTLIAIGISFSRLASVLIVSEERLQCCVAVLLEATLDEVGGPARAAGRSVTRTTPLIRCP